MEVVVEVVMEAVEAGWCEDGGGGEGGGGGVEVEV